MNRILLGLLLFVSYSASGFAADFFPQIALGGGYQCILFVTNRTNEAWSGWGKLMAGNNAAWAGNWALNGTAATSNVFNFDLAPKATRKFVMTGDATLRAGYLQIFGGSGHSSNDVSPVLFYNYLADSQLQDSVGVPAASPSTRFLFPVEKSQAVNTGVAWALRNTAGTFQLTLTLFDGNGLQLDQITRLFAGHEAKFFTELFQQVPAGFVGTVRVESPTAICLVVLRLESTPSGFQLTSIPAETNVP